MTAEVAILNQYGVALAADSAVTIGNTKVWQSSNKLFSVHPSLEIGVMIYGSASYLGIPFETIIKDWRHSLVSPEFSTLRACADNLVSYIGKVKGTEKWRDFTAANHLFLNIRHMADFANPKVDGRRMLNDTVPLMCKSGTENAASLEIFDNFPSLKEFSDEFSDIISELADQQFDHKLYKKQRATLVRFCWEMARRKGSSKEMTGIVVAGFGKDESLPKVSQFICDASYLDYARIWLEDETSIDVDQQSAIISYAQSDVAELILEGINSKNVQFVRGMISGVLEQRTTEIVDGLVADKDEAIVENSIQEKINQKIISNLFDLYEQDRHKNIVNPVLDAVSSLPKEEICVMAEALVDITSLVRKVGSPLQTVGGPVDVAIISKGDGFIWMRRKEYFSRSDNPGYLTRADISVRRTGKAEVKP